MNSHAGIFILLSKFYPSQLKKVNNWIDIDGKYVIAINYLSAKFHRVKNIYTKWELKGKFLHFLL